MDIVKSLGYNVTSKKNERKPSFLLFHFLEVTIVSNLLRFSFLVKF